MIRLATVKQFNYPSSCVAINEGNNKFTIQKLPQMVQLSCVNAVCITDIDNDGIADLVLGGNKFSFLPQFGRQDANYGHVLMGEKNGGFNWISPVKSGLLVGGETRDIISFSNRENKYFLFFRNNDFPVEYELKGGLK